MSRPDTMCVMEETSETAQAQMPSFPFRTASNFMRACLAPTSMVSYAQPPSSPGRVRSGAGKGYSGPLISILPKGAMLTPHSEGFRFEYHEPTSPKVSCIGQVKKKKHKHTSPRGAKWSTLTRLFSGKKLLVSELPPPPSDKVSIRPASPPTIANLKQFASAREAPALTSIYIDLQDMDKNTKEGCGDGGAMSLWKRRCAATPASLNLQRPCSPSALETPKPSTR